MSEIKTGPNTEAAKQLIQICAETIFSSNAKQLQRVEAFLDELTGISLPPIIPTATDAACAEKDARIRELEAEVQLVRELHKAAVDERKRLRGLVRGIQGHAYGKNPDRLATLIRIMDICDAALSPPRQPGGEGWEMKRSKFDRELTQEDIDFVLARGEAPPEPMTAKPDVWTHSQEDEEAAIARGRALERVAEAARPITHRSPELHAAILALDAAGERQ